MRQVNFVLWFDNLILGPGESGVFFEDHVSQINTKRRWFTVIQTHPLSADLIANDQMIEITHVFHVLKGKNRALDGPGGTGTLRVYVTVRNFNPVNPVTFQLYKVELSKWQGVAQG